MCLHFMRSMPGATGRGKGGGTVHCSLFTTAVDMNVAEYTVQGDACLERIKIVVVKNVLKLW